MHTVRYGEVAAIALTLLLSVTAAQPAHGQVPTAADVAACKDEAPRPVTAGSVSPRKDAHARAQGARARGGTLGSADVKTGAVESLDPQLHGMQAAGATDATYQAAFRSCMRRKGF